RPARHLAGDAEPGIAEQGAELVQAQPRVREGLREQVEAAGHQPAAEQRHHQAGHRAGGRRGEHAAPVPGRAPAEGAEPDAEADRAAEQQAFHRPGDVAGRAAEQQVEGVQPKELDDAADQQAAERTAGDGPAVGGPGSRVLAAMPALTPAPPTSATTMHRHTITRTIETAPMPGCSGWLAPRKP